MTVTNGVLKIAPIEKATPPEAEALAARPYAILSRIRITDLLAEVAGWTGFSNCFTLRPQPARHRHHPVEHAIPGARRCSPPPDQDVADHLLAHLSPLGREHVNLTGDYVWYAPSTASENTNGLRPLWILLEAHPRAA